MSIIIKMNFIQSIVTSYNFNHFCVRVVNVVDVLQLVFAGRLMVYDLSDSVVFANW